MIIHFIKNEEIIDTITSEEEMDNAVIKHKNMVIEKMVILYDDNITIEDTLINEGEPKQVELYVKNKEEK